ncbi:MAG: hypothetical protein ABSF15_27270 [Candidatus Sulfotelmatobacter sp.]
MEFSVEVPYYASATTKSMDRALAQGLRKYDEQKERENLARHDVDLETAAL